MRIPNSWLYTTATIAVVAIIACFVDWRRNPVVPTIVPRSPNVASVVVSPPLPVGAIKPNVASLRNAAPPEFEPAKIDPKWHRDFQLAKGEEHIVAHAGDLIHLHLRGTLEKGWHTYPTRQIARFAYTNTIYFNDQPIARIEDGITWTSTPSIIDMQACEAQGGHASYFTDDFIYDIPLRVAANSGSGRIELSLSIKSKVDNDIVCLSYTTMSFPITLTIVEAASPL